MRDMAKRCYMHKMIHIKRCGALLHLQVQAGATHQCVCAVVVALRLSEVPAAALNSAAPGFPW